MCVFHILSIGAVLFPIDALQGGEMFVPRSETGYFEDNTKTGDSQGSLNPIYDCSKMLLRTERRKIVSREKRRWLDWLYAQSFLLIPNVLLL